VVADPIQHSKGTFHNFVRSDITKLIKIDEAEIIQR